MNVSPCKFRGGTTGYYRRITLTADALVLTYRYRFFPLLLLYYQYLHLRPKGCRPIRQSGNDCLPRHG
jgi:hypothetical protein